VNLWALRVRDQAVRVYRDWSRRLGAAWRNSLQLRVGASTVIVTAAVVLIIGIFLVNEISAGVLRTKRSAAEAQVSLGRQTAEQELSSVDPGDVNGISTALSEVSGDLTETGTKAGLFSISIGTSSSSGIVNTAVANQLGPQQGIPPALQRIVEQGNLAVQYARIDRPGGGGASNQVNGLIVGTPVSARAGQFELYYLFPLTAEQATVAIVQRTVLISGLVLVLFVALVTLLVTRQVVRPVRVAAQTAARLAAGDLRQRIKVQGHDDIGRLGQSFNDMAGSLQRQIRRLEELSRLQRRFTSDVSHELRTPLTTIRMAAEVLHASSGDFPPELARSAELLTTELDRFEALLADLLEISRYDSGVARLETEPTDLRAVVHNSVDASRTLALRHGSDIQIDLPGEPVVVDIDPRRVERIMRNLLGNALDHGEGHPVRVTVRADDDAVAVTVRDHGVGLRPGEAGLVFNRFWRGDPSRSRLTGGTGLGLAISLEDARLHGGWLQAWGERGSGAQFRLTLPRRLGDDLDSSPLPLEPIEVTN
jgi:two-component system, OmpR family, sensor histidine kinase MtrB